MNIFVNIPEGFRNNSFITSGVREKLAELGDVKYNSEDSPLQGEDLLEQLQDRDVLITGWGQPIIKKEYLGNVKLIAHTGGTIGGIVDLGVFDTDTVVLSGNQYYAQSVAEGVIAYMLYALRKLSHYEEELRAGQWNWDPQTEGLLDKKVGLISLGTISTKLIPMLKCFTNNIKVYSTHSNECVASNLGFTYASLEEIFQTCDIVSVHTAKNDETYHMIQKKHFELMQEGTLFVNTARGAVVDEEAMIEALREGKIRALLDVYEKEPLPLDSPLRELNNVILFPHTAGPTYDRRERITLALIDDVVRYMEGKEMQNVVTKEMACKMTVS